MLFFIFFSQNSTLKLGIFHNKNNYLCKHKNTIMSLLRVFLVIIFPPLAVIDRGAALF